MFTQQLQTKTQTEVWAVLLPHAARQVLAFTVVNFFFFLSFCFSYTHVLFYECLYSKNNIILGSKNETSHIILVLKKTKIP